MIEEKTNTIINELMEELKQKYPSFRGIYLFGSRARGDFNEESDYNLAVVFNRKVDWNLKSEISRYMGHKMIEHGIVIDNPVFSYNNILNPNMALIDNILKDGIFYE